MVKLLGQECLIRIRPSSESDGKYVVCVNDMDGNFLTSNDCEHEKIAEEIKSKLLFADELLDVLKRYITVTLPSQSSL